MTAKHAFAGNVAIAGIGATEFSKESGRSELRLAVEAVKAALDDAGIAPSEVQGTCTYGADTNPDIDIARSLGFDDLTFFSRIYYGGGAAAGTIQQAALAVLSPLTIPETERFNALLGQEFFAVGIVLEFFR